MFLNIMLVLNWQGIKIYLGKEILSLSKNLKIICTASTGTNHIDLNYCKLNNK